ncbi:MAG: M15 family metallopeptidase [Treponema sp.]|nr:M15 family metallopeptidase [Treponema sp.]
MLLFVFFLWLFPLRISGDSSSPAGNGAPASYAVLQGIYPELILKCYLNSFPQKVKDLSFSEGDWSIRIEDETFLWAEGRLLPASLLNRSNRYISFDFSPYPDEIPSPELLSPQRIEELYRQDSRELRGNREEHYYGFYALLYGGGTRREIESNLVRSNFLGHPLTIHKDIAAHLSRVEAAVRKSALSDPETAAFVKDIGSVGAYNWRDIQGTGDMSYHSWGLAVDIQPKNLNGKTIYWLWERSYNKDWMLVPLPERWQPPDQVIKAFEDEGFIWGGKWEHYDNMHFEYRPELHELNRLLGARKQRRDKPFMQDLHHISPYLNTLLEK